MQESTTDGNRRLPGWVPGAAARARHWAGWCAAFLSGGLLGIVGSARARRRDRSRQSCDVCRRRRRVRRGFSLALSLVVLTGLGLSLHQRAAAPNMPGCGTGWVIAQQPPPGSSSWLEDATRQTWHGARRVLTAPMTGIAYGYADSRGSGLCATGAITVAFVPSAASDTGMTVGGVFLTGLSDRRARSLAKHESDHVTQWALLTLVGGPLALPVLYAVDEAFFPGSRNHFERAAGLDDGGYSQPADFGPQPQWGRLAVFGLVLLLVLRRRLRWSSRVLAHGRTAAQRSEPGRCALDSRGWFRIRSR